MWRGDGDIGITISIRKKDLRTQKGVPQVFRLSAVKVRWSLRFTVVPVETDNIDRSFGPNRCLDWVLKCSIVQHMNGGLDTTTVEAKSLIWYISVFRRNDGDYLLRIACGTCCCGYIEV